MNAILNIKNSFFFISLFVALLPIVIFYGTGLHGDDLSAIIQYKKDNFNFFNFTISHLSQNFFAFFNYLIFFGPYVFINLENYFILDFFKYLIHVFSFFFIYIFIRQYFDILRSFFFVLIFLTFPIHDSINFWYMTTPWFFTISLVFFSFYLLNNNKYILFFIFGLVGIFSSYSSPPYAIGLSYIFLHNKKYKKFFIFLLPVLIYVIFYLYFRSLYPEHEFKIQKLSLSDLLDNFVLIILSSFESAIGPSLWLKIYYSLSSLNLKSIILSFIFILYISYIYLKYNYLNNLKKNFEIFISFLIIFIASCFMFSLTGRYLMMDFNLGNRVTIYLSLLLSIIFITFFDKKILILISCLFVLCFLGLSEHWKKTYNINKNIIKNIYNNEYFYNLKDSLIIVKGGRYSKLGFIDNIEFLSMPWVVQDIFQDSNDIINVTSASSYLEINENYILDTKFNIKYLITKKIFLYDVSNNKIKEISKLNLIKLIESSKDVRHWYQYYNFDLLNKLIISLSPRLMYMIK